MLALEGRPPESIKAGLFPLINSLSDISMITAGYPAACVSIRVTLQLWAFIM